MRNVLTISMIMKFNKFLIEFLATYILSTKNIKYVTLLIFNNAYGHTYLYILMYNIIPMCVFCNCVTSKQLDHCTLKIPKTLCLKFFQPLYVDMRWCTCEFNFSSRKLYIFYYILSFRLFNSKNQESQNNCSRFMNISIQRAVK